MSFAKLTFHAVFAPRNRQPVIIPEKKRDVYSIIYGMIVDNGAYVHRIGGMADHVHTLFELPATVRVSDFLREVKRTSSHVMGRVLPVWDNWQEGYSCFSVSRHDIPMLINYIKNQKEHHSHKTFLEEYRDWLIENGISPDEPYFPKLPQR